MELAKLHNYDLIQEVEELVNTADLQDCESRPEQHEPGKAHAEEAVDIFIENDLDSVELESRMQDVMSYLVPLLAA